MQVTDGEARMVESVRQDREVYDLPPVSQRSASPTRPVAYVPPTLVFLDLPVLLDGQMAHRPLLAAGIESPSGRWSGLLGVFRSTLPDEGFSWVATVNLRARIGTLAFDFHSGPVHRFDQGNELYVDLPWGTLVSITDEELLAGGNALAVETAPGVWEVLQSARAELVSAGRYKLTRLLRGQRGTEWAMAPVVPAGARVVVLDEAMVELPISVEDVGVPFPGRVGPGTQAVSSSDYRQAQFPPRAVGVEPFAGIHAVQPHRRGRTVGNLTIEWIRRSRDLSADIWGAGEVTIGEESESYEIDILDGAAVKRTLSATTTSVVYTSAQQAADWGAALGPGASLDIVVYQIAPVAGRGFPYRETLFF